MDGVMKFFYPMIVVITQLYLWEVTKSPNLASSTICKLYINKSDRRRRKRKGEKEEEKEGEEDDCHLQTGDLRYLSARRAVKLC